MKFTDKKSNMEKKPIKRSNIIASVIGHIVIVVLGLITFSGSMVQTLGGDNVISVDMIILAEPLSIEEPMQVADPVQDPPEEIPQDIPEPQEEPVAIAEETVEEPMEEPPEITPEVEIQPELPQETVQPEETPEPVETEAPSESTSEFATIEATGSAGSGVPGPGTYESRVFNAIRRGFRTSLSPEHTYRVTVTISPDGDLTYVTHRYSGVSGFDRAVQNALAIAQIPPNVSRTVVTINIEFEGIE